MSKNKTNKKPYTNATNKCALEKFENGELSFTPYQNQRYPTEK